MKQIDKIVFQKINVSPKDILSKREIRYIMGGYGYSDDPARVALNSTPGIYRPTKSPSGTCGWSGAGNRSAICGISKSSAQNYVSEYGGNWCCDSCSTASYC